MNILKSIPWRKWIFVAGLVGLGINGLVQVTLQRDMRDKTTVLASQVRQAQSLSGKMTDSLSGLPVVEHQSENMASTLQQLSSQTADMDHGLAILQQTVQGIANAIQSLGGSTSASSTSLTQRRALRKRCCRLCNPFRAQIPAYSRT